MPEGTGQIASIIGVQTIVIIGISLLLLAAAWKGFVHNYPSLSAPEWRATQRDSLVVFSLIFILMAVTTITGVYARAVVAAAYFWTVLVIIVVGLVLIVTVSVLRKLKKIRRPQKANKLCTFYHLALLLNATSIFCNVLSIVGTTSSIINVQTGAFHSVNFEWSRWLLLDGISCFVFGIFATGIAYFLDKTRQLKTKHLTDG